MPKKRRDIFTTISFLLMSLNVLSQYAPQAGKPGTTAIHKDSISFFSTFSNFKENEIIFNRGWQNLADTSLGKASLGTVDSFFAAPPGSYILSLGDKGEITIPLKNGLINQKDKPEFVIFENGFPFGKDSFFLELAIVEVSMDGKKYFRFPAHSKTDTNSQIGPFGSLKAHEIHNLAGKYVFPYGVPFEMDELNDSLSLIRFIRIIDVGGSINNQLCTRDADGNKINDPFPTPFPSSGFDLLMIGFTESFVGLVDINPNTWVNLYPNPVRTNEKISLNFGEMVRGYAITDGSGKEISGMTQVGGKGTIQIDAQLNPGLYFLRIENLEGKMGIVKFLVLPHD